MNVGTAAANGYYKSQRGYEPTGNAKVDAFYGNLSPAVKKSETKGTEKILGLTTLPYSQGMSYGMSATYSEASAETDPIVRVSCNYGGEQRYYDVHINEVNPRNASQLEMFALSCYTDDKGITDGGTFGSFSKMKAFGTNAAYLNEFPDLQDPANAGIQMDWVAMLYRMAEVYRGNPQTFSQALLADGLAKAFDKWADRSSETFSRYELPDLPQEVWSAWYETIADIDDYEMLGRIGSRLINRIEALLKEKSADTPEEKTAAVLKAVEEVLQDLGNSLTDTIREKKEVREELKTEKSVYESFIGKLKALQQNRKEETVKENAEEDAEKEEITDYRQFILEYMEKLFAKIKNGDTEQKFAIGSQAYTIKEWKRLLEKFDDAEDMVKEAMKELARKAVERAYSEQPAEKTARKRENAEETDKDAETDMLISETLQVRFPIPQLDENGMLMEDLYLIAMDRVGIRCLRAGQKEYEWEIAFADDAQYERAQGFMDWAGSLKDNCLIAADENFWKDFLKGKTDISAFQKFFLG